MAYVYMGLVATAFHVRDDYLTSRKRESELNELEEAHQDRLTGAAYFASLVDPVLVRNRIFPASDVITPIVVPADLPQELVPLKLESLVRQPASEISVVSNTDFLKFTTVVHPAYRRQGIARALTRHVEAAAREAGAERIFTAVVANNPQFYGMRECNLKEGYRPILDIHAWYKDHSDMTLMGKELKLHGP